MMLSAYFWQWNCGVELKWRILAEYRAPVRPTGQNVLKMDTWIGGAIGMCLLCDGRSVILVIGVRSSSRSAWRGEGGCWSVKTRCRGALQRFATLWTLCTIRHRNHLKGARTDSFCSVFLQSKSKQILFFVTLLKSFPLIFDCEYAAANSLIFFFFKLI